MIRDSEKQHYLRWLASLKPGDKAVLTGYTGYDRSPTILTVQRLTPTQIVGRAGVAGREMRFRRSTGVILGKGYSRLNPITDEVLAEVHHYELRRWLSDLTRGRDDEISKIPPAALEVMRAAYMAAMIDHQAEKAKKAAKGAA